MTNSFNFLPQTDYLMMIENGEIVNMGKFDDLIKSNGNFSEFYRTFLTVKESNIETTSKYLNSDN